MEGLSADFRDPTPTGGAGYYFFFLSFLVSFRFVSAGIFFRFFPPAQSSKWTRRVSFYISLPVV